MPAVFGQYSDTTVAGGGPPNGVQATTVAVATVRGLAVDSTGNVYLASTEQNRVYKVAPNGVLTIIAGDGNAGYSGDGGAATAARLNAPSGVAVDAGGTIYIADSNNFRIRKIAGGVITTLAGNGNYGFSGDGGPAANARIGYVSGIAADAAGAVYIADNSNNRVRKVAGGVITTIAGTGGNGYSGDGGPAINALLSFPINVAVDGLGNVYVGDSGNYRIRKIAGGTITTFAGTGTCNSSGDGGPANQAQICGTSALAADTAGTLYLSESGSVRKVSGGTITTVANVGASALAADGANLFLADLGSYRVRKLSGGVSLNVAGNGTAAYSGDNGPATSAQVTPAGIAANSSVLYIADPSNFRIRRVSGGVITTAVGTGIQGFTPDGNPASGAVIGSVFDVGLDGAGNLYFGDVNRVRKVTGGVLATVAGNGTSGYSGDGGPALSASITAPTSIAVDTSGVVYIADQINNRVRKVANGVITLAAGGGPADGVSATTVSAPGPGVAQDSAGNVYIASSSQHRVFKVATDGTLTTVAGNGTNGFSGDGAAAASAQLSAPRGVALDSSGNIYIADSGNFRVRKVSPAGIISTVAGTGSYGFSGDGSPAVNAQLTYVNAIAADASGTFYFADTGNQRVRKVAAGIITTVAGNGSSGFAGDGGPATSARIGTVSGVAIDGAGNLYLADSDNHRVRRVSGGVITTVAGNGTSGFSGDGGAAVNAQLGYPDAVAVDTAGNNLFIGDRWNHRVRRVTGGIITTVAGNGNCITPGTDGPATAIPLCTPEGLAVNGAGTTVYIASADDFRIRKLSGGVTTTIAGNGSAAFSGDGGPAVSAQMGTPTGLAVDNAGRLYISDSGNRRVRVVSAAGTITTFAGGGTQFPGDGGAATNAVLAYPRAVRADAARDTVYIADRGAGLLRKVTGGIISTVTTIGSTGSFSFGSDGGLAVDSARGGVYLSDTAGGRVRLLLPVSVSSISPSTVPAGSAGFNLTVNGTNFGPGDVVFWDATALSTTLDSSSRLTAIVDSSRLANPDSVCVSVVASTGGQTPCQTFTVSAVTGRSISGQVTKGGVALAGVTVTLSGTSTGTRTTDGAGNYLFGGLVSGGNYTVTPSFAGHTFTPPSAAFTNIQANQLANFTAAVTATGTGLGFFPVTPCRIADTRPEQGKPAPFGAPRLEAYAQRDFSITAAPCNVSATAEAFSLSFTAIPSGPLDFLSAWPAGAPYPSVSTLNSPGGTVLANAAIVPAGTNGGVTVVAGNPMHLVIDANGYFAPPAPGELLFYPVTPCRVADTRPEQGKPAPFGAPMLPAYSSRDFPVRTSPCGIPSSAQAYALNLTAIPAGPLDFLSVWPAGQPYPRVSTLNSPDGNVIASAAIVPAGSNGSVTVVTGNPSHVVIDINGYFAPPATGGLRFYALTPCRVADTRPEQNKTGPFGPPALAPYVSRDIPVRAACGVAANAQAYSLNVTVVPSGPLDFLSIWQAGQPYPSVSTLNSPAGRVIANAAIVPAGSNGSITVVAGKPTHLIIDINGYFAP